MLQPPDAVVVCHDLVSPLVGAGGIRTVKIARELADRGRVVTIVAPSHSDMVEGIPVISIPAPSKLRSAVFSAVKFNFRLFSTFLRLRKSADLFVIHNALAGLLVAITGIIPRPQLMYDITDLHAEYYRVAATNVFTRMLGWLFVRLEVMIIKRSARVVVVSDTMKQHLCRLGVAEQMIDVVYDGVTLERFSAEKESGSNRTIGHVGLVDKQHGVGLLVPMAAKLRRDGVDFDLRVVGDGRVLDSVKRAVRREGLDDFLTFTGHVAHAEVPGQLRKIRVGVIPRPVTEANDMIITLKLMEYWASGTVVVAAPLKAIREIATEGENIIFFEPGNPDSLAAAVARLLDDPKLCRRIAGGGYERSRDFSWDTLVPQIVDSFGVPRQDVD
ncbi:MAG TPA: hypothetical protein DIT01_09870 [Lentisphaeria bacterium]|nr:hypothetical protein [Lentisphaeria bacterium]